MAGRKQRSKKEPEEMQDNGAEGAEPQPSKRSRGAANKAMAKIKSDNKELKDEMEDGEENSEDNASAPRRKRGRKPKVIVKMDDSDDEIESTKRKAPSKKRGSKKAKSGEFSVSNQKKKLEKEVRVVLEHCKS